jgi:hypothetical protein
MQRFRALSGPFEYQLRFSPEEIDDMCLEALTKADCLPKAPEPIRIDRLIEKQFTPNIAYEEMKPGVLGYTAFNPDGSIACVGISSNLEDGQTASERRLRSTLAHEGGHCLLHPSLFMQDEGQGRLGDHGNVSLKDKRFLCRNNDIDPSTTRQQARHYDGRWWEWQANRAIGGFLLPRHLVRMAAEPFLTRTPVTGIASLPSAAKEAAERKIAAVFEVNPVVARIRLSEMFPYKTGEQIEF